MALQGQGTHQKKRINACISGLLLIILVMGIHVLFFDPAFAQPSEGNVLVNRLYLGNKCGPLVIVPLRS